MVITNFANKWEIIIIIRDKKNRDKFFVRWKKIGEKYWSGKISSGKNLVTCKKFSHFSLTFFPPIRYCSKLHHRWLKKVSWTSKVLWNYWFMMKLLFDWTTFSEPLLFKNPCFFQIIYTFSQELLFQKMLSFRTANFRLLTLFSQLSFLLII